MGRYLCTKSKIGHCEYLQLWLFEDCFIFLHHAERNEMKDAFILLLAHCIVTITNY